MNRRLCLFSLIGLAFEVQALEPGGSYWSNADASGPAALRASLHDIIDDHRVFPYTSFDTDTWDILEQADADRDQAGNIVTIYRNASFPRQGGGNDFYNREHTWPKSYGYPEYDLDFPLANPPYTDMHALFLSDPDYNYARSNHPYNDCETDCSAYPSEYNDGRGGADANLQTGEYTDGRWTVWRGRRGDVARALMYLDVRYEGGVHGISGAAEPDLVLTDDLEKIRDSYTQENLSQAYMGMRSVLLRWHREDPVDAAEYQHHETVARYQGNRNPFIDHPEWAACVFESDCAPMRINSGISDAWFSPATAGQGFFITVWQPSQYLFVSWFTFDYERPGEDSEAIIGAAGHRWLTAQGTYDGNTATLEIYRTRGGVFDRPDPAADPAERQGTMVIHFSDCENGTVIYDLPAAGIGGAVPIRRIINENVPLCENLNRAAD